MVDYVLKFRVRDAEQSACDATVEWGDGSANESIIGIAADDSQVVTKNHNYATNGTYTLRITADDKQSDNNTTVWSQSVTVTGNTAANSAPTITQVPDKTFIAGQAITPIQISGTDPDGDTVSFTVSGLPAGLTYDATNKQITGTPTGTGSSTITVVGSDGKGGQSTMTFNATVSATTPANKAPVVGSAIPKIQVLKGLAKTFTIPSNAFFDPDGDALTYSLTGDKFSAALTGNTITFNNSLNSGYLMEITATDPSGASAKQTVQVELVTVSPGTAQDMSFTNTGPIATFSFVPKTSPILSPQAKLTAEIDWGDGSKNTYIGLTAGSQVQRQHTYSANGNFTARVRVKHDGATDTSYSSPISALVTITGAAPNNNPVIQAIGNKTFTQGTAITSIPLVGNDPDGDAVTFTVTGLPAGLSYDATNKRIAGTPTATGSNIVTVNASDGKGGTASTTFTITVNAATPTAIAIADNVGTKNPGETFTYDLAANDTPCSQGTTTYELVPGSETNCSVTIDPITGVATITVQ